MGRDPRRASTHTPCVSFQFTRPHGARPAYQQTHRPFAMFQFTRPHGARQKSENLLSEEQKFQFTRPHGARLLSLRRVRQTNQFQFTRPHGARPSTPDPFSHIKSFNSRARMGRDREYINLFSTKLKILTHSYYVNILTYLTDKIKKLLVFKQLLCFFFTYQRTKRSANLPCILCEHMVRGTIQAKHLPLDLLNF